MNLAWSVNLTWSMWIKLDFEYICCVCLFFIFFYFLFFFFFFLECLEWNLYVSKVVLVY